MSRDFQPDVDFVRGMLDDLKTLILENNKNLEFTHYYIPLGKKTFLQLVEETFNDSNISTDKVEKYTKIMKIISEKMKSVYAESLTYADTRSLELQENIEYITKLLGFSGDIDMFSELENTIKRLEDKEIES